MLILLSLILIVIENNISENALIACVSLPFLTYLLNTKKNFVFIVMVYFLIASQSDKYFLIFCIISIYMFINFVLASNIEYNIKSVLYYIPLQIITYILLSYKFLRIEYFVFNLLGIIIFNYFYTRCTERNSLRKINEI